MDRISSDSEDVRIDALHRRMAEYSLGGYWQDRERNAPLVPYVWSWSSIFSCLEESGEVIGIGGIEETARRRTVNLVNPALVSRKATSRTIQMSVQLVKPGETAECHRHSTSALRFVIEADGNGYTNVEGEPMSMEPGDVVLTPRWMWHDHHNAGSQPMVWLDVHDLHLANHLDATIHENYIGSIADEGRINRSTQPISKPDGYSQRRLGTVRSTITNSDGITLPYTYKWHDTLRALEETSAVGESDPHDGVLVELTNPLTGGPTLPTIVCRAQMLGPGEATCSHRHTSSTIYHVVSGVGMTEMGTESTNGANFCWSVRDCFFVPSMTWHRHCNDSTTDPAILFSVTDQPVLENLGLYFEESE